MTNEAAMKTIKLLSVILLVLILGLSGCEMEKDNKTETISQIKSFLTGKYEAVSFDVLSFETAGFSSQYDSLRLKTMLDGKEVVVYARKDADGNISDNYFGYLIKNEYDSAVLKCANKYFDDCFADASTFSEFYPNSLKTGSGFEDLLACRGELREKISVVVVVNEASVDIEAFEEKAKAFCSEWNSLMLPASYRIICVDQETYSLSNKDNYRDNGVLKSNVIEYSE